MLTTRFIYLPVARRKSNKTVRCCERFLLDHPSLSHLSPRSKQGCLKIDLMGTHLCLICSDTMHPSQFVFACAPLKIEQKFAHCQYSSFLESFAAGLNRRAKDVSWRAWMRVRLWQLHILWKVVPCHNHSTRSSKRSTKNIYSRNKVIYTAPPMQTAFAGTSQGRITSRLNNSIGKPLKGSVFEHMSLEWSGFWKEETCSLIRAISASAL